jgi:hypothetical protein
LQRLVIAYKAGREVDLRQILKHELLPVPISIASIDTSGSLKSGNKLVLKNEILKDVEARARIQHESDSSALIIDGQALVQSLRTHGMKTLGYFADELDTTVFRKGNNFSRIDVLFHSYRDQSINPELVITEQKGTNQSEGLLKIETFPFQLTSLPSCL